MKNPSNDTYFGFPLTLSVMVIFEVCICFITHVVMLSALFQWALQNAWKLITMYCLLKLLIGVFIWFNPRKRISRKIPIISTHGSQRVPRYEYDTFEFIFTLSVRFIDTSWFKDLKFANKSIKCFFFLFFLFFWYTLLVSAFHNSLFN